MQIGSGQSPLSLALVKALAAQPAAGGAAAAKAPQAAPTTTTTRPVTATDAGESPGELRKPPRGSFVDLRV